MKKLLTLSFAVLFVVALSSLSFAQAPTPAPEVAQQGEVVVQQGDVQMMGAADCCGPVMPYGCYAPCRPFNRGCFAPRYSDPCCNPCPAPCPPRPACAPMCDPCCDPCGYPGYGYGYRTPVRNFLGRVFGCGPYGYAPYGGYGYGYGYGGCCY